MAAQPLNSVIQLAHLIQDPVNLNESECPECKSHGLCIVFCNESSIITFPVHMKEIDIIMLPEDIGRHPYYVEDKILEIDDDVEFFDYWSETNSRTIKKEFMATCCFTFSIIIFTIAAIYSINYH